MPNKLILPLAVFLMIIVYGCATTTVTFDSGVKKINEFDKQFGATMKAPPNSTEGVNGLLAQLVGFRAANADMDKSLVNLLDFRIKSLEAERLHIEGWQWGKGSTTDYGFGCKGYIRIKESSRLRNASAQRGYEPVDMLEKFIEEFPDESKIAGLTQKDALALNAMYFQIEEKASKDARLVENLCGKKGNETKEVTA